MDNTEEGNCRERTDHSHLSIKAAGMPQADSTFADLPRLTVSPTVNAHKLVKDGFFTLVAITNVGQLLDNVRILDSHTIPAAAGGPRKTSDDRHHAHLLDELSDRKPLSRILRGGISRGFTGQKEVFRGIPPLSFLSACRILADS